MGLSTFRIGSPRRKGEGLRIGTMRVLPRGVKKSDYAKHDYFDVWLPNLAPSQPLLRWIHAREGDEKAWRTFRKRYAREMERPEAKHIIATLAALGEHTNLAVGCYCEDESHCHRSVLIELLKDATP